VKLAVGARSLRFEIGDVEDVRVRAARKSEAEPMPRGRARAVAAREVRGLARLGPSVAPREESAHGVTVDLEARERRAALDDDAGALELGREQALVLVLREHQHERVLASAAPDVTERNVGPPSRRAARS